MGNVILTVPKDKCQDIEIRGLPFVQVDVGMDADNLILNLLKWESSGEPFGAVMKKKDGRE